MESSWARVLVSTLAGAVGFFVGFYVGFFVILSIWGLDAGELAYVSLTVAFGSLLAGAAISLTVARGSRLGAVLTALGLGIVLGVVALALDADPVGIGIGGLILVVITALLARTGTTDFAAG